MYWLLLLTTAIALSILIGLIVFLFLSWQKKIKENIDLKKLSEKVTNELSRDSIIKNPLLNSVADGVYIVDIERNLIMLNPAAEEMTGWTKDEAAGLKCWTIMNLKDDKNDASICQNDCPALKAWQTGQNTLRDDICFVRHRGQKSIQISSSYAPIRDPKGKYMGAICVFRDITQKKEEERERKEFVSTASHELRTPITALEGYISLLENPKIVQIDQKGLEYVGKAHQTALGMSQLIQNLLTLTKMEDAKMKLNVTKFSLHDLAAECVEALQQEAIKKNLYLKLNEAQRQEVVGETTLGRSLNVSADKEKIREVFYNLIENGLKFTTAGGVSISIYYDKDFATVTIADSGVGIPADGQKHIFEKFYRVDNSATRETGGTGLGLYITRSLVELSGGSIWLESQVGKGTKFYFTLPRAID
jgi:PAS domain S-box-containing protein